MSLRNRDRSPRNERPADLQSERDSTIVGWTSFGASRDADAPANTGEIMAIYLAPEAWSSGVGRALWLAALDRMTAQGFTTVTLWVIAGNARAIRFYTAAGFAAEPLSLKTFTLGGVLLEEIRYGRTIDS